MSVKSRIGEIVAKFRAEGVADVEKGAKKVEDAIEGLSEKEIKARDKAAREAERARQREVKAAERAAKEEERAAEKRAKAEAKAAADAAKAAAAAHQKIRSSLAAVARRAVQTSAAMAAIGSATFGGVLSKSIDRTLEGMTQLRRVTSLTRLPPEFVSFFERFGAESGLDKNDVAAIFSGFSAAAGEAAADAESTFAKAFKSIGISVKDAKGRTKNLAALFADLARAQKLAQLGRINQDQFDFTLNQVFGDDDALKVSELLTRLNEMGPAGIKASYDKAKAGGALVTADDVKQAKLLQVAVEGIKSAIDTVSRSIATKTGSSVGKVLDGLSRILERNAGRIGDYFQKQFSNTVRFVRDLVKAFSGYDFFREIFPQQEFGAFFPIVYRIRDAFYEARDAVLAFGRDLRSLYDVFGKLVRGESFEVEFETAAGAKIFDVVAAVRDGVAVAVDYVGGLIEKVADGITYVRTAWAQARQELEDDGDGEGLSSLGKVVLQVLEVIDLVNQFADAYEAVFVKGGAAPAGFEWMETVRTVLKELEEFLKKLGSAYEGFAKPVIDAIDSIAEKLTGMKLSTALLGLALLNLFGGKLLLGAIGSLASLLFGGKGLATKIGSFGRYLLGLFGAGGTATAAVAGVETAAVAASAAVGTAAGAATTTAATAATTATTGAVGAVGAMLTTIARSLSVWAAGLGLGALIGHYGTDALLGDYLERRNDESTRSAVEGPGGVRDRMNADLDRYGDKRASAAAYEAQRNKQETFSGGYDFSRYQTVADVRNHDFGKPAYTAETDALASYTSRQSKFAMSDAQIDAANVAIDGKIDAANSTIDARNAQLLTDLVQQPIVLPDGRRTDILVRRDQADALRLALDTRISP